MLLTEVGKQNPFVLKLTDHMKEKNKIAISVGKAINTTPHLRHPGHDKEAEPYMYDPRQTFRPMGSRSRGRASSSSSSSSVSREVRSLQSDNIRRLEEDHRRQANLVGSMAGKRGRAWVEEGKNEWIPIRVHEYVPADERNKKIRRECTDAVCTCLKRTKGMYRFTYSEGGEEMEDYFSDGDETIKVTSDGR